MSLEFDFEGLDDFMNQIVEVANEFPGTCEKHLRAVGNKMKKELKQTSPDGGHDHKNKLKNSWKSKSSGMSGAELKVDVWSEAPHFHLLDRGHVIKTPSGKIKGFMQGKHFLEAAALKVENEVLPGQMEKLLTDVTKKMG